MPSWFSAGARLRHSDSGLSWVLVSCPPEAGSVSIDNSLIQAATQGLRLSEVKALTAAILDRLLHNAHVINIKGRSYRLRDLEHTLGAQQG